MREECKPIYVSFVIRHSSFVTCRSCPEKGLESRSRKHLVQRSQASRGSEAPRRLATPHQRPAPRQNRPVPHRLSYRYFGSPRPSRPTLTATRSTGPVKSHHSVVSEHFGQAANTRSGCVRAYLTQAAYIALPLTSFPHPSPSSVAFRVSSLMRAIRPSLSMHSR